MSIKINEFAAINNMDILNDDINLPLFFTLPPNQTQSYEIMIKDDSFLILPFLYNENLASATRNNIGILIENTRINRKIASNYITVENVCYTQNSLFFLNSNFIFWSKYMLDFFAKAGDYLKISLINYNPVNTYTFNLAFYYKRYIEYFKEKKKLVPFFIPLAKRDDPASIYNWVAGMSKTFIQDFRKYKDVYCYGPIINNYNYSFPNYQYEWNIKFDDESNLFSDSTDFHHFAFNPISFGIGMTKAPFYRWKIKQKQFDINILNTDIALADLRNYNFLFMIDYKD